MSVCLPVYLSIYWLVHHLQIVDVSLLSLLHFTITIADAWSKRWISSTHKGSDAGKFVLTAGKFYGDAEKSKGIQTSQVSVL